MAFSVNAPRQYRSQNVRGILAVAVCPEAPSAAGATRSAQGDPVSRGPAGHIGGTHSFFGGKFWERTSVGDVLGVQPLAVDRLMDAGAMCWPGLNSVVFGQPCHGFAFDAVPGGDLPEGQLTLCVEFVQSMAGRALRSSLANNP